MKAMLIRDEGLLNFLKIKVSECKQHVISAEYSLAHAKDELRETELRLSRLSIHLEYFEKIEELGFKLNKKE